MKTKKHRLNYTENFDFNLIGLTSNENDYRLVWKLNSSGKFLFESVNDLVIKTVTGNMDFSQYEYEDPETLLHYRLLGNKSEKGFLLEELKNIDYLVIIQGDLDESGLAALVDILKKTESIQGVFRIQPSTLKNKERLLR